MRKSSRTEKQCPAGVEKCSVLAELANLRAECRRLEEISYVDALTGLYNFRYLQRSLETEMERTRRSKLPTGLIMIDLDHFKKLNNDYGHEVGNSALAWASLCLRQGIRIIDVPCRYGGEEFALILPGTSLLQCRNIAERLHAFFNDNHFVVDERQIRVTASFGVAVYRHSDDCDTGEFLKRADELLYRAKSQGRNRVCTQDLGRVMPEGVTAGEKEGLFAPIETDDE